MSSVTLGMFLVKSDGPMTDDSQPTDSGSGGKLIVPTPEFIRRLLAAPVVSAPPWPASIKVVPYEGPGSHQIEWLWKHDRLSNQQWKNTL